MAVNSQFLFFYIDELIKHHWVDWLEGPLSRAPLPENGDERGFQKTLGDTGAGPRTRAGEAFNLGILSGRIVRPQVANSGFPSGWQAVIDGKVPATKLGYYSYVIGKALRENPTDPNLERALDCLASIFILHIGFRAAGRWFNTALVFQFVVDQLESESGQALADSEKRYLAAAVINTLDSENRDLILGPYASGEPVDKLLFEFKDGSVHYFNLIELPAIAANKLIGVRDVKREKAPLFWASPDRGIYTRAMRSQGHHLVRELLRIDRELAGQGKGNLLEETLGAIEENEDNQGIFSVSEKAFSNFPELLREWQDLESELFDATNNAAEAVELDSAPPIWTISQQEVRGKDSGEAAHQAATHEVEEAETSPEIAATASAATEVTSALSATATKKTKKELKLPSPEFLQDLIDRELDEISEEPPAASSTPEKAAKKGKTRVTQTNFAEKEARNRKLGEAGEFFVYQYEIQKLNAAGKEEWAKRVSWVSKELGDGLGYDIRSFDLDGGDIFLEVKTTTSGRATPFFVSNNEVAVSEEKGTAYRLVRVFNFLDKPRFFTLSGNLSDVLQLEVTSYRARI